MKLVMTANFSWIFHNHIFLKPLNPILGETYQAYGQDGTKLYFEQTAHHPPRSHLEAYGPDGNFKIHGYTEYEITAGMQSSEVHAVGFKEVIFKDGGKIRWNLNNDYISGILVGTMNHQLTGTVTFTDEANGLTAYYKFNAYTFRKQDFVWGEIHQNGKKIGECSGNYMGYLDFDDVRYWDAREKDQVFVPIAGEEPDCLPSSSSLRTDGRFFISKSMEEAQVEKERLENLQRHDRSLREAVEKRRANGGPLIKQYEAA